MKISELQKQLAEIFKEHGDLLILVEVERGDRSSLRDPKSPTVETEEITTSETVEVCKHVEL